MSLAIFAICLIFFIVGSFVDLEVSKNIYDRTDFGTFFANYGAFIPYFTYAFAGGLFFVAFRKKGNKKAAWGLLVFSYLVAMFFALIYMGPAMRSTFGFGDGNYWGPFVLSFFYVFILFAWIPPLCIFFIDDSNPKLLIKIALLILLAGLLADGVNMMLSSIISRPTFEHLRMQKNYYENYQGWWIMNPFQAGTDASLRSAPSIGVMTATMVCVLPLASKVFRYRFKYLEWVLLCLCTVFIILSGYNVIHMGNGFMSDVAFGACLTYVIYLIVYVLLFKEKDFDRERYTPVVAPKMVEEVKEEKAGEVKEDTPSDESFRKGRLEGEKNKEVEVIKKLNKGGLEAKRIAKLLKMDVTDVLTIINKK